ncbi:MFS transporter [Mesorhizobium shangrilense]|uniref:MFS transporter n=1 Tax=Mesorhizobium shangrilense TaxID=460060 RepID=A0ABV2DGB3_9HYPH
MSSNVGTSDSASIYRRSRRQPLAITSAVIGTTLEWFDYSVYAAVAAWIATEFFPSENSHVSLLSALAVFGVGFFFRPLGALFFGHMGDRKGRKHALAATIILMGASSLLIAVAPNYTSVGLLAPVLLVVARCAQGFSAGGEFAGGAAFLIEGAPEKRRGTYGAIHYMAIIFGNLLGAAIVASLIAVLSGDQMKLWGWRIPFLIGACAALVGLFLRARSTDTPIMQQAIMAGEIPDSPISETFRDMWKLVLRGVGLVCGFTIVTYAYVNMQSYIPAVTGLSAGTAQWLYSLSLAVQIPLIGFFGFLSDKVGRKPLMLAGAVLLTVCPIPVFALVATGSTPLVLLALIIVSVSIAVYAGPFTAAITELMPRRTRYTALSVSYGLAAALFGGTAGYVVTWLRFYTASPNAPAIYAAIAAALTLITVISTPETVHRDISK